MQHFVDVYGDIMQQRHRDCQNCCVLMQIGSVSQCGLILTYGDRFLYVLTIKNSTLQCATTTMDINITFGDGMEKNFNASRVVVQSGNKLSILLLLDGIETVQAKQKVHFRIQDDMEDAVVYTLSYIPKATYNLKGHITQCSPANSCFRGGNSSTEHEGVFYHNCCVGTDITEGSAVLNGRVEVIGLNLKHSTGWTMALCLKAIYDEIVEMFPETQHKTFAGIQEYLEAKGEVEAEAN